jgi:hypothetical protein
MGPQDFISAGLTLTPQRKVKVDLRSLLLLQKARKGPILKYLKTHIEKCLPYTAINKIHIDGGSSCKTFDLLPRHYK